MQAVKLEAKIRELTGKKVKKLRQEGMLPAAVYGKGVKSESLMIPVKEFSRVYEKVGETGLVELTYAGKNQHVLVKNVQIHPLTRLPLHAELLAVKLTEKIKTNVPLVLVGESPAVINNVGVLIQTLNEVEVEALPMDLPENIEVEVNGLSEVGQKLSVVELKVPKGVAVLTDGTEIVVNVAEAVAAETAKEVAAEEAAKAEAAAEAGETAAETPTEEKTAETPKEEEKK